MTRQEARESAKEDRRMAELKLAYADGKTIQFRFRLGISTEFNDLLDPDFNNRAQGEYRIKPEPVFRYWSKPEDVPVGRAVMRTNKGHSYNLITGVALSGLCYGPYSAQWDDLDVHEHAMILPDGDKGTKLGPWMPCGKEEA